MANYGTKNSDKRAEWYRDVVDPICNAAHAAGFPACGISAAAWNSESGAGVAGSHLAAGKWPATLRNRAELLAEQYGITFTRNTTLANLTNARAFVAQMQLEAAWSGQADATDGGGAGGGDDEVPYLLDPGYTWAPGPDGVLGTSDDTAEVLVPTVVEDTTPWLWIGLGTAALAGGVVWWLRRRQAPALAMGGAAFMPSDGYARDGYDYPWGP